MLNGAKNAVGKTATVTRKAGNTETAERKITADGKTVLLTGIIEAIKAEIIATPIIEAIKSELIGMQIEVIKAITGMRTKDIKPETIAPAESRRVKPDEFSVKERVFIRHAIVTPAMVV